MIFIRDFRQNLISFRCIFLIKGNSSFHGQLAKKDFKKKKKKRKKVEVAFHINT